METNLTINFIYKKKKKKKRNTSTNQTRKRVPEKNVQGGVCSRTRYRTHHAARWPQAQPFGPESLPLLGLGQIKLLHCSKTPVSFRLKRGDIMISKALVRSKGSTARGTARAGARSDSSVRTAAPLLMMLLRACARASRDGWNHASQNAHNCLSPGAWRPWSCVLYLRIFFCILLYCLIFTMNRYEFYKNSNAIFFFLNVLFTFETETEREQGRGRERETQTPKQGPGSEPSTQSPTWGSDPRATRS